MEKIWLHCNSFNKHLITAALESGISTFMAGPEIAEQIRQLARVTIAGQGGDLEPGRDFHFVDIVDKERENLAASLGRSLPVVITTPDWEIIPIENLIAAGAQVIWSVPSFEKARLAFEILEHGVFGVLLACEDPIEVRKFASLIASASQAFKIEECEIVNIEQAGLGDRVCVDTASVMTPEQGMLAGNSSAAMLLVQSESTENPYVAARPFRVNLSAVHAYTPQPEGKTTYLSELASGKKVVIVDRQGKSEIAVVGRIKMERRPMIQVSFRKIAVDKQETASKVYHLLLQNAETVRVFNAAGGVISVASLKPGDKVLGTFDKPGRHFGMRVEESIDEK